MIKEIWKPIEGYEDFYQVSNLGHIKSLQGWNGHKYVKREKILNGWISTTNEMSKRPYRRQLVSLIKNGKIETFRVHRLVAEAFIDNPNNKPQVNHIDGNSLNNKVNNLEWATSSENNYHAYKRGLKESNIRKFEKKIIKEYQDGASLNKIVDKYKVGHTSLKELLNNRGIKIRSRSEQKLMYNIDKKQMVEDFESGMRNVDIAKKYNTNRQLIGVYKYKYKRGELKI